MKWVVATPSSVYLTFLSPFCLPLSSFSFLYFSIHTPNDRLCSATMVCSSTMYLLIMLTQACPSVKQLQRNWFFLSQRINLTPRKEHSKSQKNSVLPWSSEDRYTKSKRRVEKSVKDMSKM